MYVYMSVGMVLRQYLIDKGIEAGDLIFVDHRKTSDGISINETGGYANRLDTNNIEVYTVQVMAKYYNVDDGSRDPREVIQIVNDAFLEVKYLELSGMHIDYIHPMSKPAFFAQEDTNLVYFCNYEVHVSKY